VKVQVDHLFTAAQQELWELLHDPARLTHCIPGCEQMVEAGRDKYTATLKIGVASVKGSYVGQVQISEKQPCSEFKLSVDGSGRPGFVRGLAAIGLLQEGERQTRMSIDGEAQVGGAIASVGQRLLYGIARQMIGSFFRNIEKELSNGGGRGVSRGEG
jgi:carbon monoxide dehydrogenase subunit G